MIGYYVHHVGSGHSNRARAVAGALGGRVVGLSSLARPEGWRGDWVVLDRDDGGRGPQDVTARGQLHWVPRNDPGLRRRMARIAAWIDETGPDVLVSDVSVEVALLARLHGVPVLTFVLPGDRTDPAHLLGYGVSDALVACWPEGAGDLTPGLPADLRDRISHVGALSRLPVTESRPAPRTRRRVTVLLGRGGGHPRPGVIEQARAETPDWDWTVLGPGHRWTDDVQAVLVDSDVVVTQAGENALAEVAACRRPAIVVPAERPHSEQRTTAAALAEGGWPVLVEDTFPASGWPERLSEGQRLDGAAWAGWCDGKAAERLADLLEAVAGGLES